MKKLAAWLIWGAVCCGVIGLNVGLSCFATSYDKVLTKFMGTVGEEAKEDKTSDEVTAYEKEVRNKVVEEGTVLLKNDNKCLPFAQGSKVSVFGQTAYSWMTKEKITNSADQFLADSLNNAGLECNPTLAKFYKRSNHKKWGIGANLGNGGIRGTWAIDECPVSEFKDAQYESFKEYNDAAIVVFSRSCSEGGDLPRYMDYFDSTEGARDRSYLELDPVEKELLKTVKEQGFKKIAVLLHTGNPMEMTFADQEEYGIDSVMWVAGTGQNDIADDVDATYLGGPLDEVANLITGKKNFSGHLVDTFVYDNFSAPCMQNYGDFRFTKNGKLVEDTTTTVGGTYSYNNYGENIYVGYKYYETRYEDKVTNANDAGTYDYASTVAYPFGYGLSYTTFEWSDFKVSNPNGSGDVTASVKVTNTGDMAGKDVVQFYFQSPYTDYDKTNGVEKAATNLIEFGKTKELNKGESDTVSVTFNLRDVASYDAKKDKTYILESGNYLFTAASDAHEATNNFLAYKGFKVKDGMTKDGNTDMVKKYEQSELKKYDTSKSGYTITNQFEDCQLSDAKYLTRSNWKMMDNDGLRYATGIDENAGSETMDKQGFVYTHEITDDLLAQLQGVGWSESGNPYAMDDTEHWGNVSYSQSNGLTLNDLVEADYNDARWEKLLDQMSQDEQLSLIDNAMYGTCKIDSVGKPETYYLDGPQGMIDYVSGGKGFQFEDEIVLGATWNKELAKEEGDACSLEFKEKNVSIWWSPAMNNHRSPFSGRNWEYFSEDGIMSGLMGVEEAQAACDNGVLCQLKHCFLNDQEENRGANGRLATYCTEQAIREIYLKPFQMTIEGATVGGVMTSMARIGSKPAPLNYNININVLRGECGMKGAIITDAQSLTLKESTMGLAAGLDMVCTTMTQQFESDTLKSAGGKYMLRQSAKNTLYVAANSCAMGVVGKKTGYPIYMILVILLNVVPILFLIYGTGEVYWKLCPDQKAFSKPVKWVIRGVMWAIALGCITALLIAFFTSWLPALQFAFQTI